MSELLSPNVENEMSDKVMLTLQDLHVLAATAERNGTQHNFPEVALQWAAAAQAEIERLRAALLGCARKAEALKLDCGMDPESAQALRNARYQDISTTAHIALGTIRGPEASTSREPFGWAPAPKRTEWGDGMVLADVEIDRDHTLSIYAEADQAANVAAALRRALGA